MKKNYVVYKIFAHTTKKHKILIKKTVHPDQRTKAIHEDYIAYYIFLSFIFGKNKQHNVISTFFYSLFFARKAHIFLCKSRW
jgi:hypothetical protein